MIPLRDENPTRTFPFVTLGIIIANVLLFIYELNLGNRLEETIMRFAVIPYDVTHRIIDPRVIFTLFSALFFHGGFAHIFGNMLYLWVFGNNIEDRLGHLRFIFFYFACGIFATIGHIVFALNSKTPLIGASGAISGILGAYLILYPRAKVLVLFPFFLFWRIIKVSAGWFLLFWIGLQFINVATARVFMDAANGAGVAWFAHIGGFFAGIFLLWVLTPRRKASASS
jgi:membrane associated rhomboid family serine protease